MAYKTRNIYINPEFQLTIQRLRMNLKPREQSVGFETTAVDHEDKMQTYVLKQGWLDCRHIN